MITRQWTCALHKKDRDFHHLKLNVLYWKFFFHAIALQNNMSDLCSFTVAQYGSVGKEYPSASLFSRIIFNRWFKCSMWCSWRMTFHKMFLKDYASCYLLCTFIAGNIYFINKFRRLFYQIVFLKPFLAVVTIPEQRILMWFCYYQLSFLLAKMTVLTFSIRSSSLHLY